MASLEVHVSNRDLEMLCDQLTHECVGRSAHRRGGVDIARASIAWPNIS